MSKKGFAAHLSTHSSSNQHLLWFRLWIGFLIGVYATYASAIIFIITNKQLQFLWPGTITQGIAFIVLPLVCIFFLIKLLQYNKISLYVVATLSYLGVLYQVLVMHADVVSSLMITLLFSAITLAFVVPHWSKYK